MQFQMKKYNGNNSEAIKRELVNFLCNILRAI